MRTGRIYPDAIVRPLRRPWLVLAIAVAVVALPTVGLWRALRAGRRPRPTRQTFQDSVGENPAAPDITTVTVSNDDAATHHVQDQHPEPARSTRSDVARHRVLDSDANQATGDRRQLWCRLRHPADPGRDPCSSSGTARPTTRSVRRSRRSIITWSSGPTIRINASDLNNTRKLAFDVHGLVRHRVRPVQRGRST